MDGHLPVDHSYRATRRGDAIETGFSRKRPLVPPPSAGSGAVGDGMINSMSRYGIRLHGASARLHHGTPRSAPPGSRGTRGRFLGTRFGALPLLLIPPNLLCEPSSTIARLHGVAFALDRRSIPRGYQLNREISARRPSSDARTDHHSRPFPACCLDRRRRPSRPPPGAIPPLNPGRPALALLEHVPRRAAESNECRILYRDIRFIEHPVPASLRPISGGRAPRDVIWWSETVGMLAVG